MRKKREELWPQTVFHLTYCILIVIYTIHYSVFNLFSIHVTSSDLDNYTRKSVCL